MPLNLTISKLITSQIGPPEGHRRLLHSLTRWLFLVGELSTSSDGALDSALIVGDMVVVTHPGFQWKV